MRSNFDNPIARADPKVYQSLTANYLLSLQKISLKDRYLHVDHKINRLEKNFFEILDSNSDLDLDSGFERGRKKPITSKLIY